MHAKVQKWGNSLAVRIPKAYAEQMELHAASDVEISVQEGGLVILPVEPRRKTLDELLEGITPDNIHPATDWGPPVGKEVW